MSWSLLSLTIRGRSVEAPALALLAALFGVTVYRAATQSITHDEACTYNWFLASGPQHLFDMDANNHILNTLLARAALALCGHSELSLRLPSLLGALCLANFHVSYFKTWRYDAGTRAIFAVLASRHQAESQSVLSVGGHWIYEPSINFYRQLSSRTARGSPWLARGRAPRAGPGGKAASMPVPAAGGMCASTPLGTTCRRILAITLGSLMNATMRIVASQRRQAEGSAPLIRRMSAVQRRGRARGPAARGAPSIVAWRPSSDRW